MTEEIYDPLDQYIHVFKDRFRDVCRSTFTRLATESGIDPEANRLICAQIDDTDDLIVKLKRKIKLLTVLCVVVWVIFAAAALACYRSFNYGNTSNSIFDCAFALLLLCILLILIHPRLKVHKQEREDMEEYRDSLLQEAWQQMEPLNRLYDWDIFTRMMSATIPRLEFDPFFTTRRLEELKTIYGWDEAFNAERSVLFSHSGLINGNPFVICRTKKMEWGEKKYTGQLTIHWTESVRDSDGKYHTRHRSQTLHATITRPYPEYHKKTRLIYGNTAAPDLTFTRTHNSHFSTTRLGRWLRKTSLRRKARSLASCDYAMLTNEEFEVAFDTSDRNHNQQFALLFTPLAQISMMNLLADKEEGYGDDFDFEKARMINFIIAAHMQSEHMDMNPEQYRDYSFDRASQEFHRINAEHFRAIYFAFAPLLAVPMYQQIRPHHDIYGSDMALQSAYWEHEALANFWGVDRFKHPDCATDCILKTEIESHRPGSETTIRVEAYGYRAEPRVDYVKKLGGDGFFHSVPVHWDEYLPVTGSGTFDIKEHTDRADTSAPDSQTQRIQHIQSLLTQTGHSIYRRHISSRV